MPVPGRRQAGRRVGLFGTGAYVPEKVLSNADLAALVDTTDEWIVARTGMRERHIAAPDEATSDLALRAARRALDEAGLAPADLQLIIVATVTPDSACPPTACLVQHALGAQRAAGFDLSAACSGFVNALMTGHGLVAAQNYDNALVIGADILSSITDYTDRESCILFGDGAGAVVLGAGAGGHELLDHVLHVDGSGADLIRIQAGGSRAPATRETVERRMHFLRMQGRCVFKFAVAKFVEVIEELLERNQLDVGDLDVVVPHQANARILEAGAAKLGIDMERLVVNVDRLGNTSSASIPMALDDAARSGRISPGQLVALVTFGGGLTWGGSLLRW